MSVISNVQEYRNKMEIQFCNNSILAVLDTSKQYCREKEKDGFILVDLYRNCICFYSVGRIVEKFKFPPGMVLYDVNAKENTIRINSYGVTSDACTIKYRDREGKLHKITLCVGTAYVLK